MAELACRALGAKATPAHVHALDHADILVVDDTHASLRLLTDILTAEGYRVRPADSGELLGLLTPTDDVDLEIYPVSRAVNDVRRDGPELIEPLAEEYRKSGQQVHHTIQTNGTLLTDEWCELFAEHDFLVGISIDGPPALHDAHRVDKRGNPTSAKVLRGLDLLRAHGVECNVLCTVNAANQDHGVDVYRYFRDELGARYLQFIPIVEAETPAAGDAPGTVTDRSVPGLAYGEFLSAIFDEWVRRDVGEMFVQFFDGAQDRLLDDVGSPSR